MSTTSLSATAGASRPRLSLATLSLVLFLTFLDNTIVSVTLSNIQSTLHTGVSGLQWVVSAYALVFASLMLPAGTVSDLLGRKKVMLTGVAVFCAGSVLGALAPNVPVLWAARAIMGLGAAASEPGTLSMIRHLYTDRRERAQALGVWAAVSGLALAAGPVIGGALVGVWSWRAVFWFNLFFGLLALVGAAIVLPENADPQVGRRFDFGGFVLGAGALAACTFAIIAGESAGYHAWWVITLFVVAGIALVAFVGVERRAENPILDVRFFRRGNFAGSTFVAFATYFGVFSIFFFVAMYLELVGNQSGYQVALDFLPMAAAMVLSSALAGRWVAEMGPRVPMTVGCLLGVAGIVLTAIYLSPTSGLSTLGWTLPLAGLGFGCAIVPVTSAALSAIPPEHSGMAASATNTSRELGAVAGVAVLGSVVNGELTVRLAQRLNHLCLLSSHGHCILPAVKFKGLIITAVTTGTISAQAKSLANNKALVQAVNRVTQAAYGAFTHGLDLSLGIAAGLMALSAIVALGVVRWPRTAAGEPAPATGEAVTGAALR
ncbi:MAG TPA: MFS transporter [Acidimicrobiales bacterium]|nr:MFS transporter [Acidimicrobiales bacterium]